MSETPPAAGARDAAALNRQAWELRIEDARAALRLALQAAELAQAAGDQLGYSRSRFICGHCHYRLGDYAAARGELLAALALAESLGDREGRADALNALGTVLSSLGDYHGALDYFLQGLAIRRALGLRQAEAASLNNIGNVYHSLADYGSALAAHRESLAIKRELGDQLNIGTSLNNIGNALLELGDRQGALESYTESLTLFQSIQHGYGEAGALCNLGSLFAAMGNLEAAREYYLEGLAIERRIGDRHGEAESLVRLGELALRSFEQAPERPDLLDQALSLLEQGRAFAGTISAGELIYQAHQALAKAYELRGDLAAALAHHRAFYAAQRAIFDAELREKSKRLQILLEVETSKREAALRRAEAELYQLRSVELAAALERAEQSQQVAEQASRLKSELLSIAAHDLRNPLGAIAGYAELIQVQTPPDTPGRECAEKIGRITDQMLAIINDLLGTAAIDGGKLQLNRTRFDMSALAEQLAERNRALAHRKDQTIELAAAPACLVDGDEARIREVIDNLLSNAIKYSPYGRTICVAVARRGDWVQLRVRDEGPGLTQEDRRRMFGRFTRLSATPTGGESAIGLGLAIVKLLVDLHGGRVWAESDGPQTGSTFLVELPAATRAAEPSRQ